MGLVKHVWMIKPDQLSLLGLCRFHANGHGLLPSPSLAQGSKELSHRSRAHLPSSCNTDEGSKVSVSYTRNASAPMSPLVVLWKLGFLPNASCTQGGQTHQETALCTHRSSGKSRGHTAHWVSLYPSLACEEQHSLAVPRSKHQVCRNEL